VQATAQTLENANAELGSVVQSRQVNDIPVNGRDWAVLMALAPGESTWAAAARGTCDFVGRAIDDSNYTFDGLDATGVQEQKSESGCALIPFTRCDRGVPREFPQSIPPIKGGSAGAPNQRL